MYLHYHQRIIAAMLAVALSGLPLGAQTLDLAALIRECERNGAAMHRRLPEYTYLQRRLTRAPGEGGKLSERIREYEAFPIKAVQRHRHVIVLISKDGVALPPERIEQERLAAAREMEQLEKADPAIENQPDYVAVSLGIGEKGEGVVFGVSQFLRHCDFSLLRHERSGDRDTLVLSFQPRLNVALSRQEKYLEQLTGIVWVDAADKVVIRLEAWLNAARYGQPPLAVYEQVRLTEGLWVPRRIQFNALGKAAHFNGLNEEKVFEFSAYQRFNTSIESIKSVP